MRGSTVRYSDFYNMMSSFESAGESSCCMVAKGRAFMEQEPGSSEIDTHHCVDDSGTGDKWISSENILPYSFHLVWKKIYSL